jgi:Ca2+-binding RTX toxin-like protein
MRRTVIAISVTGVVGAVLLPMAPANAAHVTCHGVRATIVGTARSEVLVGTSGRDVIAGRGGNDTIKGRGGNDLICGGYGADVLYGGPGNDKLYGGHDRRYVTDEGTTERDGDLLRGGSGDDRLVGGRDTRQADDVSLDAISWDSATHAVHIDVAHGTATGQGHDSFATHDVWVIGSSYADTITGSAQADHINGGPGSDVIRGGAGADRILGEDSIDRHHAAADRIWGGEGKDEISTTQGSDTVYGGSGSDFIDDLGRSADHLVGGPGADTIVDELWSDADHYSGGSGTDRLDIFTNDLNPTVAASTAQWDMASGDLVLDLDGPIAVTASGFEQGDLATYGTAWTITGTSGDDTLFASGSAGTSFTGLAGDDTFMGSANDDTFNGGPGHDHSLGMGVGEDTCISVEVLDYPDCEHIS